jgi:acyl-CoA thioesterase-1
MFFWSSTTLRGDPLCFVDRGAANASASLLFPPAHLIELSSGSGAITYEEGRDFVVGAQGLVVRSASSRIPITTEAELYPMKDGDRSGFMFKRDAPDICLMFNEDGLFHQRQVQATYSHRPGLWSGHVPQFAGKQMPRTMGRLRAREPLSVAVTGDSISEGYNASAFLGLPPHQPSYVDLVTNALALQYGSAITTHNFACAGWTADNGLGDASRVAEVVPDLVIVAFGMNDAGYASRDDFGANIAGIMREVRHAAPDAEFVLVSPMLPNPEWHYPVIERFPAYRSALHELRGDGVVVADVTTLWSDLLVRKSVYDLTGNGINHPNDFGHRVYADTILSLFVDVEKPQSVPTYP